MQDIPYHYSEEEFICPGDAEPDPRAVYEWDITEYTISTFHLKLHSVRNRCGEGQNIEDFIKGDTTPAYYLSGNKLLSSSFEPLSKEHFPYEDWDPYTQESLEYVPYGKPLDIESFIQEKWLDKETLRSSDEYALFGGEGIWILSAGENALFILKDGYPYYYIWELFPFTASGPSSPSIFGKIIPFYEEKR